VSKSAFLSSTGADLRAYREAAFLAIQKLDGWKCIRMEDFGARDWDVDSFCLARAEECDLFVGIIGHRFGDGPKGSKESYTQREYRAAREAKKPVLLYLAPDDFSIPANLREPDSKIEAQEKFREELTPPRRRELTPRRVVDPIPTGERAAAGRQFLSCTARRRVSAGIGQHRRSPWPGCT
jgi:hypothetical protein